MAKPIINGFESSAVKNGYRTRFILDKATSPEEIASLVNFLDREGLHTTPVYYKTSDITSIDANTGPLHSEPYETVALIVEGKNGANLKGKISGPAGVAEELNLKLTTAGFVKKEQAELRQKASEWMKPETNAAKKALKDLLAKGTPTEKYKRAMALYGAGDISGIATGAFINKEVGDAGFASLAGLATVLGYAGNELDEGKTLAEKLLDRVEMPSSWNLGVDYTGKPSKELNNPKKALEGSVRTYGKDVFNFFNWMSFAPLMHAGLTQDKSLPKIFAAGIGLVEWAIRTLIPQKGQTGLIDAEDFTESLGIKKQMDAAHEKGGPLIQLWDKVRENPAAIAAKMALVRNLSVFAVTIWDWTVSPTKMRGIEHKYEVEGGPKESKGFWKGLKDVSSKLFGWVIKGGEPMADASRFHKKNTEGKVEKYWWQMDEAELADHIKSLGNNSSIEPAKFKEFVADVKSYHQKQRLVKGGLGNLMMITSYTLANQVLGGSSSDESVNLPELYSRLAIGALAVKAGDERSTFIMDKVKGLAVQPEIRENPIFASMNEQQRASKLYNGTLETLGRMMQDNRISSLFKSKAGVEPAATLANLAKEGTGLAEKALQIPAQILNLGAKTEVSPAF